jgi:hypothetical protein
MSNLSRPCTLPICVYDETRSYGRSGFSVEDMMQLRSLSTAFVLIGTILTAGGCVTESDLDKYATDGDLDALRGELMAEVQRVQESSSRAEQLATSASGAECRCKRRDGFAEGRLYISRISKAVAALQICCNRLSASSQVDKRSRWPRFHRCCWSSASPSRGITAQVDLAGSRRCGP